MRRDGDGDGDREHMRDPQSEEFHFDGSRLTVMEMSVKMLTEHNSRHVMLRRADDERPLARANVREKLTQK